MEQNKVLCGCLRRRQCLVPTLRGWAGLVVALVAAAIVGARVLPWFLAVNDPVPGGVLVVEGWAPDYAMQAAAEEFNHNHYEKLLVTGIPLERGAPLSEFRTHAELGAAVLLKLGLSTNAVQAVPAMAVMQDRTYAMALALKGWMREHGIAATRVNLITLGPHARRSRLLFEKALGKGVAVGVTGVPPQDYDLSHWWRSSQGVRTIISEGLGYAYARFLFFPPKQ
jgi:hypothetical protein